MSTTNLGTIIFEKEEKDGNYGRDQKKKREHTKGQGVEERCRRRNSDISRSLAHPLVNTKCLN